MAIERGGRDKGREEESRGQGEDPMKDKTTECGKRKQII